MSLTTILKFNGKFEQEWTKRKIKSKGCKITYVNLPSKHPKHVEGLLHDNTDDDDVSVKKDGDFLLGSWRFGRSCQCS